MDDSGPTGLQKRFPNVYELKHHYRNGHQICLVADELAKSWGGFDPLMPTCNYLEQKYPSSVTIHPCADLEAQIAQAVVNLERQIKAYPDEYLGVLCPSRASLRIVAAQLSNSTLQGRMVLQSGEDGYVAFESEKPVCVCTVHGAKGLEFRVAHILEAESLKRSPLNRNIAYMAVTRAKTSLSIYHSKPIPGYLDSALAVVRGPVKPAKLEELFGGS